MPRKLVAILIFLMLTMVSAANAATGPSMPPATKDDTTSPRPANVNASATTKAVLSYFHTLSSRNNKRLIIGQFGAYGDGTGADTAMKQIKKIYDRTGKWVALTGMDYKLWDMHHKKDFSEPNKFLIDQWKQGSLVMVNWHAANPWTDGEANDWQGADGKPRNVRELITPGTDVNRNWLEMLDDIATGLQELQEAGAVVIWRPFHEMNGGWAWWQQQAKEDFIALWQYMFRYFTDTKGLNNLLWAYAPNVNNNKWNKAANYFYPGADYVDLVGLDKYMGHGEDPLRLNDWHEYDDLVALNKPIGLMEFGPSPADGSGKDFKYDATRLLRDIRKNYPKIVFVQSWEWIWQLGDQDNIEKLLNDPWIVTRSDLPRWR